MLAVQGCCRKWPPHTWECTPCCLTHLNRMLIKRRIMRQHHYLKLQDATDLPALKECTMSAKSPSNALMQQWLVDNASSSPSYPRVTIGETEDEGLPTRLYTRCLYMFRYLCKREAKIASTRTRSLALKEELGKLYLRGQAFFTS